MEALVYTGPRQVEVTEVPEPAERAGAVKVRMLYCGVCGTDIGIYSGKHPRAQAPLVLGHEFVGRVEQTPPDSRFAVGDRVVAYPLISCGDCHPCRNGTPHVCANLRLIGIDRDGGMTDHQWIDESVLFKVPDSLSDEVAALVEPLAVVVRTLHQARFALLDSAVVMGAGPIGLLTAIVLRHSGASRVIVSDVDEGRLGLCRQLGFDTVDVRSESLVERVASATGGDGADAVFECSGVESAALEMTKVVRVGGTICLTATHKAAHAVNLIDVNFKELTLIGSRVYTHKQFGDALALADTLADELRQTITQVVPLSDAAGVFEMIATPSLNTVKVLVDCQS
ncbi:MULTISPECIES: alcohol dehydrogenase catalytic domain-containing protein [unclassified Halomonas]|uniref:Alcohol dehydrogenase catalytic domain-containing protein n=1 Tax=Halomonas sp. RT37 TaxID=2950872 RepID=A0AAU7KLC2_9GAMM|nr:MULTISPECIES: alcohol dehydrogenase catalytic domain-containing protein [unclassified Halomonas]KJZ04381.1 dehydrogenase [Halomonas sp. S2151]MBY6108835.1 alcohol dehydrogenase catalytic domain-containing protein [Halomonas sp. DP1Y21-3]MCO7215570.1 alcohol dehydrogenase catalytic domain-containing protein [Halomonas sp. OfavH-34-E]|tara:strand:+ start:379 stop:1398 length:1020 start_codon:yes stop_codon:yes gene_type:complete